MSTACLATILRNPNTGIPITTIKNSKVKVAARPSLPPHFFVVYRWKGIAIALKMAAKKSVIRKPLTIHKKSREMAMTIKNRNLR
jgi:hypothetical protein